MEKQVTKFRSCQIDIPSPSLTMVLSGPTLPKNQKCKEQYKKLAHAAHPTFISKALHFVTRARRPVMISVADRLF